jgi:macrolide-specific efflux system membrane fusion protein
MKLSKRALLNGGLGVVVIAALVGVYLVINPPSASTANSGTQLTATVQQGTVSNTITANGATAPAKEVAASFPVSGTIAAVDVALGQSVAAGAALGTLDPAPFQRAVAEAQTQYNNAVAGLSDARAALTTAVAASAQNPAQSDANARAAVRTAQAQVQTASDGLATAKANLSGTTLTAPIAGLVVAVNGSVGASSASSGSGASTSSATEASSATGSGFVTIADVSAMTVTANIAEADIASVVVGQAATVTFPAMTGVTAQAKVTAIAPTATTSNSVVTYATTITLDSIPAGLRLGQTASVSITTKSSATTALYVPTAAITTANGVSTVKVVDARDPSKTTTVTVTLGVVGTTGTEITTGLKRGETIVLGTVSPTTTGTTGTGTGSTNRRGGFGGGGTGFIGGNFRGGNG